MKYHQYALIEFNNGEPYVERLKSDKPITIDDAAKFFVATQDFNEKKDCITFIDEPPDLDISVIPSE